MSDATRARPGGARASARHAVEQAEDHAPDPVRRAIRDVAPHVRTAVLRACGGDQRAALEALAVLGREQRRGWRILPDPLPCTAASAARAGRLLPDGADPEQVLALALCESGPIRALSAITGCAPDRIVRSPLAALVDLHGGRFAFRDAALRAHVVAGSTTQQRLRAHGLLSAVLASAGETDAARWHRACGAVAGDPGLVDPLIAQSDAALREGDAGRAWSRAVEAAEHAGPGSRAQARALLRGGCAALAGGWTADALERIEQALRIEGGHRGAATAAFVLARTLRHGAVPAPEPLVPAGAAGPGYLLAAARGAALCAERGDRAGREAWLAAGRRIGQGPGGTARLSPSPDPVLDAEACPVLDGDAPPSLARALATGLEGDPDAGLRLLAEPGESREEGASTEPWGRAPLPRARRAVAQALLHVWAGRIGVARGLLADAAAELPVALPFAGIAIALSRRLDLAVHGRIGELSRGLAASAPPGRDADGFVDRAVEAYLRGRSDEAAVHLGLRADRGAPPEPFALPGLDEVGPLGAPVGAEPPSATAARGLRERIRAARESSWRTDLDAVAAESPGIASCFERARVEALLGSTCAARGDGARGTRHLHAARSLFEESGAGAWRGMVERRLRTLAQARSRASDGEADTAASSSLEVCRAMWEPVLTARELEVALLMSEGLSNREIALALHVSVRTVEVHGGRVFAKLDVRTRHGLTVLAHRTEQHL